MKEQDAAHSFECPGCGAEINEGEFKTFGVCDACWDEGVTLKYWGPKKEHNYTDKEIIALAESEITRLRSELQQKDEEITRLQKEIEGFAKINCDLINELSEIENEKSKAK